MTDQRNPREPLDEGHGGEAFIWKDEEVEVTPAPKPALPPAPTITASDPGSFNITPKDDHKDD